VASALKVSKASAERDTPINARVIRSARDFFFMFEIIL
jgi:hypothetical protein